MLNTLDADTDNNCDKLPLGMYKITTCCQGTTKTPVGVRQYVMYLLGVDTSKLMNELKNQEVQVENLDLN